MINSKPAQAVLYAMPPFSLELKDQLNSDLATFLSGVSNDEKLVSRRLVLGEVAAIAESKYGKRVTLRQNQTGYFATDELATNLQKQYRSAWAMLGLSDARVLTLMLLERTKNGNLRVADMALQLCNRTFIPCDSSYEVEMANLLVSQSRTFEKPIRLASGDEMLPDFVLVDTLVRTHVEVYGMNGNDEYERRKQEKRTIRLKQNIPCLEWDVEKPIGGLTLPTPKS